jgi:UDPglucose 6-dehydrogenase
VAEVVVVGTGYVGLTTGVCFAHLGHNVVCVDTDVKKVERMRAGEVPIVEEGLAELMAQGIASGRLRFAIEAAEVLPACEFVFLCLPTPERDDGSVDMSYIEAVAGRIGPMLAVNAVVVNKSTVPVGASKTVAGLLGRSDVHVASNPEFLREGTAVYDFLHPSRIVVGAENNEVCARVGALYSGVDAPVIFSDPVSSETIKYAANAFLATKISFINSIANICEHVGADIHTVVDAIGRDPRIGREFLQPGPGFGGSCFPKDTIGLVTLAAEAGYKFGLLESVIEANDQQLERVVEKVRRAVGGNLEGKLVAVWGLPLRPIPTTAGIRPPLPLLASCCWPGRTWQCSTPRWWVQCPSWKPMRVGRWPWRQAPLGHVPGPTPWWCSPNGQCLRG